MNVVRKGAEAIHFVQTSEQFKVGELVHQTVDWARRFDNMQQHSGQYNNNQTFSQINLISNYGSGQHLISAIFEQDYGFNTTTWYLGLTASFIELDTKTITLEQLKTAERKVNSIIANGVNVSVINVVENGENVHAEVNLYYQFVL